LKAILRKNITEPNFFRLLEVLESYRCSSTYHKSKSLAPLQTIEISLIIFKFTHTSRPLLCVKCFLSFSDRIIDFHVNEKSTLILGITRPIVFQLSPNRTTDIIAIVTNGIISRLYRTNCQQSLS